jgi:hypothetical protein
VFNDRKDWGQLESPLSGDAVKILSKRIQRELEAETDRIGHCAIYEDESQRIWPLGEENRRAKIEQFAKEYGFKLSFYKQGLCAIFEKAGAPRSR